MGMRRGRPEIVWPARDADVEREPETPRRWRRRPEPWERDTDGYDGASALWDLPESDGERATRVVARYLTVALLRRALRDGAPLRALETERVQAGSYVALLGAGGGDAEREARALRALLALARASPPRRTLEFVEEAAAAALKSGQPWGAFALQREGYELALRRGWWPEAARAAASIGAIAGRGGGRRSARRWQLRARILARRAAAARK
jgi:hypothetical protein